MTRLPWIAGLAVVATVAAACSSSNDPTTPAGSERWSRIDIAAASIPAVGGGTVAVVDASSSDLSLVVLDAATGETRWTEPWSPSLQFGGMGTGAPVIRDGVVVGVGVSGSGDARLYGADARDGEERWSLEFTGFFAPEPCGPLVCVLGRFGAGDTFSFSALEPTTGDIAWTLPGEQYLVALTDDPAADILTLTAGADPTLTSRDATTGAARWVADLSPVDGQRLHTGRGWTLERLGVLVVGWVGMEGDAETPAATMAIDAETGERQWARSGVVTCLIELPGIVLTCRAEGGMSRLDIETGADLWSVDDTGYPPDGGAVQGFSPAGDAILAWSGADEPITIALEGGEVGAPGGSALTWTYVARSVDGVRGPGAEPVDYTGPIDVPVPWDWFADAAYPAEQVAAADVPDSVGWRDAGVVVVLDHDGHLYGLPTTDPAGS